MTGFPQFIPDEKQANKLTGYIAVGKLPETVLPTRQEPGKTLREK